MIIIHTNQASGVSPPQVPAMQDALDLATAKSREDYLEFQKIDTLATSVSSIHSLFISFKEAAKHFEAIEKLEQEANTELENLYSNNSNEIDSSNNEMQYEESRTIIIEKVNDAVTHLNFINGENSNTEYIELSEDDNVELSVSEVEEQTHEVFSKIRADAEKAMDIIFDKSSYPKVENPIEAQEAINQIGQIQKKGDFSTKASSLFNIKPSNVLSLINTS